MPLPLPPYTYDDPRLTYDEHCFFYDGDGYSSVCLAGPTAVVIRRGGGSKKRQQNPFLNVFINCYVKAANGKVIPCDPEKNWTRFAGEEEPITVFINGVAIRMKTPYVTGFLKDLVNSSKSLDSYNLSVDFIEKVKKNGEEAVAPLEESNENIKIKVIEPHFDIQVKCESITVGKIKENDTSSKNDVITIEEVLNKPVKDPK
jgi:hypothetical protein